MIEIKNLNKKYNENEIFSNFSLKIEENKITTILGPSGCGKTTLFNILSKLDKEYEGEISGVNPDKISYIFQEPRLIKWKNVYENIEFITDNKKVIDKNLEIVDLYKDKELYPKNLSGGMKQRLSIARAFSYDSQILFMDEGFTGIDLKNKIELIEYFNKVWNKNKKTVIHITHDIDEALLISDRIIQFSNKPVEIIKDILIDFPKKGRINNKEITQIKNELIKELYKDG